ncbi:membrane protein [Oceaniferula spumae]|uniref:Membrane protein n=1 Tax=Oceaniferula spumae TaxID=2979115 RepID=A0AAT9FGB4_9BACT
MTLPISTPALLFPAVSLLFLSYTNRFLHLSALIRQLHRDWLEHDDHLLLAQISNLRKRLVLIRWMQFLGAVCLFLCVTSMLSVVFGWPVLAMSTFVVALFFMAASLAGLTVEVWISGGALRIMLRSLEQSRDEKSRQ